MNLSMLNLISPSRHAFATHAASAWYSTPTTRPVGDAICEISNRSMAKQLGRKSGWDECAWVEIKPVVCGRSGSAAEARYWVNELLIDKVFKGGKQGRLSAEALRHLNGLRRQPFNGATIDTLTALGKAYVKAIFAIALFKDEKVQPRIAMDTSKLILEISCRAAAAAAEDASSKAIMALEDALQKGEATLRAVEAWQQEPTTRYASLKSRSSSSSYRPLSCLPF